MWKITRLQVLGTTCFSVLISLISFAFWQGNGHCSLIFLTAVMVSGSGVDFYAGYSVIGDLLQKKKV